MAQATAFPHVDLGKKTSVVDNPPNAQRTMEALREMGYDSYASVLDLIDNSIDADAKRIEISIEEHSGDITITVVDDGSGMDEPTLNEALRLGSDTNRETGDLGKFGMGLVTASIGLSKQVQVLTKEAGGELLYGAFDLEDIASSGRFIKQLGSAPAELADYLPGEHEQGTRITLSKTDRISNRHTTTFANTLRSRVGQVFRRYLKSGVEIIINGKAAGPIDPLMLGHQDTQLVLDTDLEVDGGTVSLRVVDLPDLGSAGNSQLGIIQQNSGFYIMRNNREIVAAMRFDFYKEHPDFSHFRAEISFDGNLDSLFHTDVKKMTIHPDQNFIDKLRQLTQGLITDSSRRARKRANVKRGQIDHSAAEANIRNRASLIPKPQALVEERKARAKKGTNPTGDDKRERTPHVTGLKTVSGLKVIFDEGDYGEQGMFYLVNQKGRTITVTYNREHPFWRELVEHGGQPKVIAILDYLVFALANSELLVPEQATIVKANVNSTLVGLLV